MDDTKKLALLRGMYVGALADACLRFQEAGILDQVATVKHGEQMENGPRTAGFLGINTIPGAFLNLQEVFACANWTVTEEGGEFRAVATGCLLCNRAKAVGAGNPCSMYCLSPIEGLVRAVHPGATFEVEETLWKGQRCQVRVRVPRS